jgi:hypothetical protein
MFVLCAAAAAAQQRIPHVAYVYPAGGQRGTSFEVRVGGEFLEGAANAYFAGGGLTAQVIDFARPLSGDKMNELREELKELEESHADGAPNPAVAKPAPDKQPSAPVAKKDASGAGAPPPAAAPVAAMPPPPPPVVKTPWTPEDRQRADELRKVLTEDARLRSAPALSHVVTLRVTIAADASLGNHELRLTTAQGLTNPLVFLVGDLPEVTTPYKHVAMPLAAGGGLPLSPQAQAEPSAAPRAITLPAVLNGQMMPGAVDKYSFHARKGQTIVIAAETRTLIPFISDAVPGWCQARLILYDPRGNELASADHFYFRQEPVIAPAIPEDGDYVLAVHDVLHRGREDFVYRIAVGESPWVTSIFPLGGHMNSRVRLELAGWNLKNRRFTPATGEAGVHTLSEGVQGWKANPVSFATDDLPEMTVRSSASSAKLTTIRLPVVLNGRIAHPGDVARFRFHANGGEDVVAEVEARRLGSPLDSLLTLTDARGKLLATNDDAPDPGTGALTHQADSRIAFHIPADGAYDLSLADTENNGGADFAYRLRVGPPQPDFDLRVAQSSISLRTGKSVPVLVRVIRRDGFAGAVSLSLGKAPTGVQLSGGTIPAGVDALRVTLTAPDQASPEPQPVEIQGQARIGERTVRHAAVFCDDQMQAFAWRSLVPAQQGTIWIYGNDHRSSFWRVPPQRIDLPVQGTAKVRIDVPRGQLNNRFQFALSDPPEGIALAGLDQSHGFIELTLRTDGKAKPGLAENLIFTATMQKSPNPADKSASPEKPVDLGFLPAIPFQVSSLR